METNQIKKFAQEARTILQRGVRNRLLALGFDSNGHIAEKDMPVCGADHVVFMGRVIGDVSFYRKWMSLYERLQDKGVQYVCEEAAYTWFNRLMAIRILAKNGFADPVLEYQSDALRIPRIVTDARRGVLPQMSEADRELLRELLEDDTKTTEQFAVLIVSYCKHHPILSACFGAVTDYTELLLPANILAEGGFVDLINHTDFIAEDDYHSSELIGWLYQFYISERKDEVFAGKGKFTASEIPAATQIFTPNWIVKYMVQNTVGRIYLDNNPYETEVAQDWKYLVNPSEPTPDDHILRYDDLTDLRLADLACGSGHILGEMFDMLYTLYINEGYSRREAIEHIFRRNLTGIDIDTRAKQLAQFALLLKACQRDASFADCHCMPRVLDMPQPIAEVITSDGDIRNGEEYLRDTLPHYLLGGNADMVKELTNAFLLMNHADTLGSIMKFDIAETTRNAILVRTQEYEEQLTNGEIIPSSILLMVPYMRIILALTEKYTALCMNPPYLYSSNMPKFLVNYVNDNYDTGRTDLCVTFMRVAKERLMPKGKYSMINMQSWMFLTSFLDIRKNILSQSHIDSLLHLGPHTFDELNGEVVQNVAFTVSNESSSKKTLCYRLIDGKSCDEKEKMFVDIKDNPFTINQSDLQIIPGEPLAYWATNKIISSFKKAKLLTDLAYARVGMFTGDNNRFLKEWWEVQLRDSEFHTENNESSISSGKKWFGYNKGGGFRKWYGNLELVVNYKSGGYEIFDLAKQEKRNCQNYPNEFKFSEGVTWTGMASDILSFRYVPNGCLFDSNKGPMIFSIENGEDLGYINAFLNTKVCNELANVLNPTLSKQINDILNIPLYSTYGEQKNNLKELAYINVQISRSDWDAHETSWDFEENELVRLSKEQGEGSHCLSDLMDAYREYWTEQFLQLHANEEELNRQFIEIYGLEDELTPDVPLEEITILQQGEISIENGQIIWHDDVLVKQFISYAVGCMMGRYRLDKPGLHIAHPNPTEEEVCTYTYNGQGFTTDEDGIVPLMTRDCPFPDNASERFKQFLKVALGEDALTGNLNFVEAALGKDIESYFVKDFWKEHLARYQRRPIYWLFSSKKGAFQCIAYMHRMNPYTVEQIRNKYLLPHMEYLGDRITEMESRAAALTTKERKLLEKFRKDLDECREYHDRLHEVADRQIGFDLDDGVVVNYAKFGDILAKLK